MVTRATPSVLIVDDHSMVAASVAVALRAHHFEPVVVVDSSDLSPTAVLDAARKWGPDIVMLDLYLGQHQLSLPMIGPLVESGTRVVLFTSSRDPRLLAAGLRAGAEAVVDKATSFEAVLEMLAGMAEGRAALGADERELVLAAYERELLPGDADRVVFEALTVREAEVLCRLIDGDAPKQIARAEGIAVSTVRGHIERIFQKLDVSSQREALALARRAGWPDVSNSLTDGT